MPYVHQPVTLAGCSEPRAWVLLPLLLLLLQQLVLVQSSEHALQLCVLQ
jgi:hypothetical protein